MADQPQESVQHPIPDRRNPQTQQSKFLGVDRRKPLAEMQGRDSFPARPGGDPSGGGEPETVRRDVAREHERDKEREKDKGYN
jgi:hypothetical protein